MNVEQFIKNCEERNIRLEQLIESNEQAVKETDKKLDTNKKRIYSVNVAAYLSGVKGYSYSLHEDEKKEGLKYFRFPDVSKELAEYKANIELQNFIRAYADIRQQLHS